MAQSPLNDTTQPVDSEEEGRSSTMDRWWLKRKNTFYIQWHPNSKNSLGLQNSWISQWCKSCACSWENLGSNPGHGWSPPHCDYEIIRFFLAPIALTRLKRSDKQQKEIHAMPTHECCKFDWCWQPKNSWQKKIIAHISRCFCGYMLSNSSHESSLLQWMTL